MNAAAASVSARAICGVEMPSWTVRTASETTRATETSGPRSAASRATTASHFLRLKRTVRPSRVRTVSRPSRARSTVLRVRALALALAIGAIEDVGLGDLVEPLAHEVLLDDVLDVLDVGEEVGEPRLHLFDHAVDDARRDVRLDVGADGADGFADGVANAGAVEGDDFARPFDNPECGHGSWDPFGVCRGRDSIRAPRRGSHTIYCDPRHIVNDL